MSIERSCRGVVLLVAVLAAVAVRAQFPPIPIPTCDAHMLHNCQSNFNDALNIGGYLGVTDAHGLRMAVEQKYAQGQAGLSSVCTAARDFKFCFASTQALDFCTRIPIGLIASNGTATGISEEQARAYVKFWLQLDFACGIGYQIFSNDDKCAGGVLANSTAALNKCESDFWYGYSRDPAQVCGYLGVAINCYWSQFQKCAFGTYWWGCEYLRVGLGPMFPQCSPAYCTLNEPL